ncbi:hypothetical protein SCLCIDRAFT_1219367 [Scleroderma citrinum Foug A]|uniref:Uncharacterized protein n=1 Tax=Scleroderma citrinum Foug A TaxID=1036808 RepID=A0A0C2Z6A5_9AGAM|nr:hypothetical protein SCLCIDRAFT_1219367 [Scleroderma citrinum Foug A]
MAELPVSDPLEQFRKRASNGRGIDMSKQGIEHCIQDWRCLANNGDPSSATTFMSDRTKRT